MCSTAGAATATLHAVPAAPRVTRKPANHAFCRLPVRADGKTEWRRQRAVQPVVCVAEAQRDMDRVFETKLKYSRVMLKVSGEALEGAQGFGIDPTVLQSIASEVAAAASEGVQIAIVVGGGNFFRGVDRWAGLDRASADYVGMLATVMNAICLQSALEALGVQTRVQTAIEMQEIAEPYIRRRAIRHLEHGRVVIFGAGTGNPFFTTDTAAALRAAEINADAFFKATKVDGVYDCDPVKNPGAVLHRHLSFRDVLERELHVMDETAITLCKENEIPVIVFNQTKPGNVLRAILGDQDVGTSISGSNGSNGSSSKQAAPEAAAEAENESEAEWEAEWSA